MASPFERVLVPFDGSDPATAALDYGIELAQHGVALFVVNVVDERPVVAQSTTAVAVYDPTPLLEALDAEARTILASAERRCAAANVTVTLESVHELPVPGILKALEKHACELVVIGTHARSGLPEMILGSTTVGVLRSTETPVLAVRFEPPASESGRLFHKLLVALDDSEPADAAATLAGKLQRALGTELVLCSVVDTRDLYDKAADYGYDPTPLADEMRAHARAVVEQSVKRVGIAAPYEVAIVEGEPATAIAQAAVDRRANIVVMGSHGRRGLRRLFLGSVAEHTARSSLVPVLVVRK